PRLADYVVPVTVVILGALFMVQRRGTAGVGAVFGPATPVWFISIAAVGIPQIAAEPAGLGAVRPLHAVRLLGRHGYRGPLLLGWFALPMVVIAALATVVASQALISGAFSLTQQAVQLGFVPRMKIVHTSATTEGQIYIPVVNGLLAVACTALVMVAGNSSNLASAYGIAVTGTMSITSVLFYAVARRCWCWPVWRAGSLVALFLAVDLAFFGANLAKVLHGGWFPMLAAGGVFAVMSTWRFGASWRARELAKMRIPFDDLFATLKLDPPARVKGTAVFMTQDPEGTP